MGHLVDRQVKQCDKCGGRIETDTVQYPGETEDAPPKLEYVESHIGSCTPIVTEEPVAAPKA